LPDSCKINLAYKGTTGTVYAFMVIVNSLNVNIAKGTDRL